MHNIDVADKYTKASGEVEFIFRDKHGRELGRHREPNLIKIFSKEMLAYRLPYSKVWDPAAGSGSGAWVASGIDTDEEWSAKYIIFGASYDTDGVPLNATDPRYYVSDQVGGSYVPIRLSPGAGFEGELINAIPISEPNRPLKRVERIYFEPSYQPAGTPLLDSDVRAINNVLVLETTLRTTEYNGFGTSSSDSFTITEVGLAGGRAIDSALGACEERPRRIFHTAHPDGTALQAILTGTDVINLDPSEAAYADVIKEGDQIKIVGQVGSEGTDYTAISDDDLVLVDSDNLLSQITPYYLVVSKDVGSLTMQLDRVPMDNLGNALTGTVGVFRDGLKLFSHRILTAPVLKNAVMEVIVRWRIIFS